MYTCLILSITITMGNNATSMDMLPSYLGCYGLQKKILMFALVVMVLYIVTVTEVLYNVMSLF